jgi:O-6-methylguanine DNA methyltransferase
MTEIQYTQFHTEFGNIILVSMEKGICYISLPGNQLIEAISWLDKNIKDYYLRESLNWTQNAKQEITEYLNQKRKLFTFPIVHINTPFRKLVLAEVSNIPFGETASYGDIAKYIGKPKAMRAVGTANATNPLPLIIPCHRIIRNDGSLGGYGGGLNLKMQLLELESNFN